MAAWSVGERVRAQDRTGNWLKANVLATRGDPDDSSFELKVHFIGWKSRFDEWVGRAKVQDLSDPIPEAWASTVGRVGGVDKLVGMAHPVRG